MGVTGNVFVKRPLTVTSHVTKDGVRVLAVAVEDALGLTQNQGVLLTADVAELHRHLGAWLDAEHQERVAKVEVVRFAQPARCITCRKPGSVDVQGNCRDCALTTLPWAGDAS
jgi:hypothetical protein